MINSVKENIKEMVSPAQAVTLKRFVALARPIVLFPMNLWGRIISSPIRRWLNSGKPTRKLEIGPGGGRIDGFETLNVNWGFNVDYVGDASRNLPFRPCTFDLIYASHILEHVPWYRVVSTLKEWSKVIKEGGSIEIWVPDGLKIAQAFVQAETEGSSEIPSDGWYKFNEEKDPCIWANGRIFSYGDGFGNKSNENWHLAIFSPRYLKKVLEDAGFVDIEFLRREEVRGYDHGWINLGARGRKQ